MNDVNKYKIDFLELVKHDDKPSQKVIVLSNLSEIAKGIEMGYTKKKIFDILTTAKVIVCNYSYFVRVLKNHLPTEKTSLDSKLQDRDGNETRFGGDNDPIDPKNFI